MGKKCCGFGHRYIYTDIKADIEEIIVDLIKNKNVDTFYTGGMGDFDDLFSYVVRKLKKQYTDIKLILVKPYFTNELNKNKDYYQANYDSVIIPDELIGAHYKSSIRLRNRWIVKNSDIIIFYVYRNFGGAYEALKYAKKQNKETIELVPK